tara:strand:+ start:187 stop:648 length:462 start_codon:yes stop_codon:yes gene_type:complete
VQQEDFDVSKEIKQLTKTNLQIGGLACFIGLVRDMGYGETVKSITVEHYPGMTETQLKWLEYEARSRWPLNEVLIIHRVGTLQLGDQIVLVVSASAHRKAALESCHFLIDWLKTKAPFWKQETTNTETRWVSARYEDEVETQSWDTSSNSSNK